MMKFRVSCLVILVLFSSCCIGPSNAQESPPELLEAAKQKFQEAYKAEYGELPDAAQTRFAMNEFGKHINSIAANLGVSAGKAARQKDTIDFALKNQNGLKLIRTLAIPDSIKASSTSLKKTDVKLYTQATPAKQKMPGELIAENMATFDRLENRTEVVFPDGTFELNAHDVMTQLRKSNKDFPEEIVFVGSSKTKTKLRINNIRFGDRDVQKLGFRNMTIDCQNDGLIDKRSGAISLQLSNVKVIRFDGGHSGCSVFSANDGIIVHAQGTDFVGGFGDNPGYGSIFGSCRAIIGHFEKCRFLGIEKNFLKFSSKPNIRLWIDECVFEKPYDNTPAVAFSNCMFNAIPTHLKTEFDYAIEHRDGIELLRQFAIKRRHPINKTSLNKLDVEELTKAKAATKSIQLADLINNGKLSKDFQSNVEIELPAGSFEVRSREIFAALVKSGKRFPDSVAFVGAGKEQTTLTISDLGRGRNDVDRLSFRNMTIDCDNDCLFAKRQGKLTLQLTNVRLFRFDAGRTLFSVNDGLIIHAQNSDFLGGHGRSRGNGMVFSRHYNALLGHFENCSFLGINHDIFRYAVGSQTKLWMDRCNFERTYPTTPNVTFSECNFNADFDAKLEPID